MTKLTGIIITKDEEENIRSAIHNLDFCDEIIVCDGGSTDKTVDLAKSLDVVVISRQFKSFSDQRNYALGKASGEWILFLDADERVSVKLKQVIRELIKSSDINGVKFQRIDKFLGKYIYHGENAIVRLVRMAKKGTGTWKRSVHEYWDVEGAVTEATFPLYHDSNKNLFDFISKINEYSRMHAIDNQKEGKNPGFIKVLLYPGLKFIDNYFFKFGFLDGIHGFVIAAIMSLHSFLSWSQYFLDTKKHES